MVCGGRLSRIGASGDSRQMVSQSSQLTARLRKCPPADERPLLRWGLFATYSRAVSKRSSLRATWGRELLEFERAPAWRWVIAPILGALRCVIEGMAMQSSTTDAVVSRMVTEILGPLHRPNDYAEWRDQLPLLSTYHADLSACMVSAIRKVPASGTTALRAVLDAWPPMALASTSKEIALLGELEELLTTRESVRAGAGYALTDACLNQVLDPVLARFAKCIASENWRLLERALHMWRREDFASRFAKRAHETCAHILPALLRDGSPHWNPTVNRMSILVLERLEAMGDEPFRAAAESVAPPSTEHNRESGAKPCATRLPEREAPPATHHDVAAAGSLTRDMRGWRPGSSAPPPVSVTGVAPWATGTTRAPTSKIAVSQKRDEVDALGRVRVFKEACASLAAQSGGGFGTSSVQAQQEWAASLTAEAPLRLPTLKFHDLVFGRELGTGAFGVVKYAKRIVRAGDLPSNLSAEAGTIHQGVLSRAHWPDHAVKVVSRQKMEFHRYERSIAREICVLRELNHPGVSRLVSAFKWRNDVYLVLEYAGGGDLHETIANDGALDLEATRFVIGSVVAALQSIHDAGFVYADLKPENILLTAAGHIKLTDFGACRGTSAESKARLDDAAAQALTTLRDGDWRNQPAHTVAHEEAPRASANTRNDDDDDDRVEGTVLYLAPEVVRGAPPDTPADVWALGCVTHFCAEARPRFEANSDDEARALIVDFNPATAFFAASTPPETSAFERYLLVSNTSERPLIVDVARHAFFQGADLYSIYRFPPVSPLGRAVAKRERITPPGDARWAQRQYSMIWAPLETADLAAKREERELGAWIHTDVVVETASEAGVSFGTPLAPALTGLSQKPAMPRPSNAARAPLTIAELDAIEE